MLPKLPFWLGRLGLLMVGLSTSFAMAQTAIIPDANTTYPDDITATPAIISQCMGCHGPQGRSLIPEWPSLAGQPAEYLESQLKAFKSGERRNDMMDVVAHDLSDEDIKTLAKLFSQRAVRVVSATLPERPESANTCVACHGAQGIGLGSEWPNLAGQKQPYLFNQLMAFKSGTRKNDIMYPFVSGLSVEDMAALAQYYSAIEVQIKERSGDD